MFLDPTQAVRHLPFTATSRVADFGAGTGEYALLIAERLAGEGAVYALEKNEALVESLSRACRKAGRSGALFPLRTNLNEPLPLRSALLHAALLSNTLHQLHERERFLSELNRTLRKGGTVLFIDWVHSFENMGPPEKQVVYPHEAVRLFESHDFSVGTMLPAGSHHYAFIATKR